LLRAVQSCADVALAQSGFEALRHGADGALGELVGAPQDRQLVGVLAAA
jgi:hypothetical protein